MPRCESITTSANTGSKAAAGCRNRSAGDVYCACSGMVATADAGREVPATKGIYNTAINIYRTCVLLNGTTNTGSIITARCS